MDSKTFSRSTVADAVRNLNIGESIIITGSPYGSVKSTVSRLRHHFKRPRRFRTQRLDYGTRVERLP